MQAAVAKKAELTKPDDKVMQFHKELMETCIDMMSRFAFSTCASMPKRSVGNHGSVCYCLFAQTEH